MAACRRARTWLGAVENAAGESEDAINGGASRELGHLQRQGMEKLFDLEVDPHEQQDVSGDSATAAVCQEMRAHLVAWMRQTGGSLFEGPVASPFYYKSRQGLLQTEA